MHDFKYLRQPAKQPAKESAKDVINACVALYAIGVTLFLIGLRAGGLI
jgi:hypothetical protein